MNANDLLTLQSRHTPPWLVTDQQLGLGKQLSELFLEVRAERGALYPCPECETLCKAHDFREHTWPHLNFLQHLCLVRARVPRVKCPKHGILRVNVPWARPNNGFTLLFEQVIKTQAREMPMTTIPRFVDVTNTRLWSVIGLFVTNAVQKIDLIGLEAFGLDESASKPGHLYVTVFIDLDRDTRPVVFATEGRAKDVVRQFKQHLQYKGGAPKRVLEVVSDMPGSFVSAVKEHFKRAEVSVDLFHIVQLLIKAVDDVHKAEAHVRMLPKGTCWGVLKNKKTQKTQSQVQSLEEFDEESFSTGISYRVKEQLSWIRPTEISQAAKWRTTNFIKYAHKQVKVVFLLSPMRGTLITFEKHLEQVLYRWRSWHTNTLQEGMSWLLQTARARARALCANERETPAHWGATFVL